MRIVHKLIIAIVLLGLLVFMLPSAITEAEDVTTDDTLNHIIYDQVNSLSPFFVREPTGPGPNPLPMENITAYHDITVTQWHNSRSFYPQTEDEVIQFTRDNVIVGTNPTGGFGTVQRGSGPVSGDLNGTGSYEHNQVFLSWDELLGEGRGYLVGTITFNDGQGNTFSSISVMDTGFTAGSHQHFGYSVSPWGTGEFSGQVLFGISTGFYPVGGDPQKGATITTFRRYSSEEVSEPDSFSGTTWWTYGNPRSLGESSGSQPSDEFIQVSGPNINIPVGDPAYFLEGGSFNGSVTGALTGNIAASFNTIVVGTQLLSVGKFTYSDSYGAIKGLFIRDGLESDGYVYMFALMETGSTGAYAGKDFYMTMNATAGMGGEYLHDGNLYTFSSANNGEPGGGCFIATAAYGTSTTNELDTLRAFRDKVLLQNTLGSQLVALYYEVSPPLADFISENGALRTLVRELFVDPVVWVVKATEAIWGN